MSLLRTISSFGPIALLCGCVSLSPGPCNFSAASAPCEASIEVVNAVLVLVAPACSKAVINTDREARRAVTNLTGQLPVGKSNEEVSLVSGSCRAYPAS